MHISDFLKYTEFSKGYAKHTVKSYASDLEQFKLFCFQNNFAESEQEVIVDFKVIRAWIADLSDAGVSNKSINRKISALKSYYKYLERNKLIAVNPTKKIRRLKETKRLPNFVQDNKLDELLDSEIFSDDFVGVRDLCIIELLYGTGIRRSELINLKLQDVNSEKKEIKVLGKRNKERIIPFSEHLNRILLQYKQIRETLDTNTDNLFITEKGHPMYPNLVYRIVKKYLAFITNAEKRSPHILRHSYATHLLNKGADINAVKELLGHGSLAATQVYTHNTFEKINRIYKQAHPRAIK